MTKDELVTNAYLYFPKGLEDSSIQYLESTEYRRLQEKLLRKQSYQARFRSLCDKIKITSKIPLQFDDFTLVNKIDRCVKGRFVLDVAGEKRSLGLYISLILDYYVLMPSFFDKKQPLSSPFVIDQTLTAEYALLATTVHNELAQVWPGMVRLDDVTLNTPVPDIVFDGLGRLDKFVDCDVPYMNIFNVYFSDYIF